MTVPDHLAAEGSRLPRWLLLAGLAAGAALGAVGLRAAPQYGLPPGAVASVDGRPILRDAWLRAVAAVASDRRTPLTAVDQRHILERLIDEELLVQHGVALGLVERDARLRGTLVSQVMQAAAQSVRAEPDEAALRAFYDEHRGHFTPAARLRVRAWRVDRGGARAPFEPAVPDALLPPAKLQAYLGPALTLRALALVPGERAEEGGVGLELVESLPATAPSFGQVRTEVRREYLRRADEAAVRELLARLREHTPVVVDAGRL
jgi:hypothetical protein